MSTLPMNNNKQDFLGGLLGFLNSPQAQGLAQGLLSQATPSLTEPRSLSGGLLNGLKLGTQYADIDRQRKVQEGQLDLDKMYKGGMLDINRGQLDLDRLYKTGELDIHRGKLELDRATNEQKTLQKQAQQQLLMDIISGKVSATGPSESGDSKISEEKRQRAATLAAGGFVEEAFKVLTEKPEKNDANAPTKAVITQNQQVSQAVDTLIPQIDELIKLDVPFQGGGVGTLFSPDKQRAYEATTAAITDQILAAFNLPKSNESIHLVKNMVEKGFNESDEAYHSRLKNLKNELVKRKQSALKVSSAVGEKSTNSSPDMVTIRNSKTGETKQVTREEAENLTRKK